MELLLEITQLRTMLSAKQALTMPISVMIPCQQKFSQ